MTPNGKSAFEWIAVGGTATMVKVTSDALVGSTTVSIQGIAGYIPDGGTIKFSGDHRDYTVITGASDVSLAGQTITLAAPLAKTAYAGTLVYTGSELVQGIGHSGYRIDSGILSAGAKPVWVRSWYEAGEIVRFWATVGYSKLDHTHKDNRAYSVSPIGVSTAKSHSVREEYSITLSAVGDIYADGMVNEYDVIESYLDAWAKGQPFLWFPDVENKPSEVFWCSLVSRPDSSRINMLSYHEFTFNIVVEPLQLLM